MNKTLCLVCLFLAGNVFSQDNRPDKYDLLHTSIEISEVNFRSKTLKGKSTLQFKSLENNLSTVAIDLLKMKIDSIKIDNSLNSAYTYNDSSITITLPNSKNAKELFNIEVAYSGAPVKDPSGWGGFYFTSDYAFNLGVGFASNPHTYGRAWYPTIDHFTERSTYSFSITTDSGYRAMCNGHLVSSDTIGKQITWNWEMNTEIPSYLVSMAVAPYYVIKDEYQGVEKDFPIWLACKHKDTNNVKGSFINLKSCAQTYEEFYGPHKFDKIGFTMVPFGSGAMEHATNIAYPISACDGTTNRETLMAHEFAHHWWGDNITCETALDMWINEGWASYSEALFTEQKYGTDAYKDYVRDNHKSVLQLSHIKDAGPRAVYGTPHEYTYGSHVYDKGADVAHTLRYYMGDKDFKTAVHSIMNYNSLKSINTLQFRDSLQKYTSRDMTSFFENWILTPGFPHLEIQSQEIVPDGSNFKVNMVIEQRTKFTWEQYKSIPIEIAFYNNLNKMEYREFEVKPYGNLVSFTLPFSPVLIVVDPNEKVSDAITDQQVRVKGSAVVDLNEALMKLTINKSTDTSLIRVEHHWVEAKRTDKTPSLPFVSKERYWTVDGIFAQDLDVDARIAYDGRTPSSGSYGYLDNKLIVSSEDNLVLLHRANENSEWKEYPSYSKLTGAKTDGFGYVDIKGLIKGQYAFGFNDATLAINEIESTKSKLVIYPNPTKNEEATISFPALDTSGTITVADINGKVIYRRSLRYSQNKEIIKTEAFTKGTYIVEVTSKDNKWTNKLVVK